MLKQQLQEKIAFLKKAYEVACEYAPSSPLSVNMNPIGVGETIGFDEATVKRIMTELVQDGHVDSGLGMGMLIVRKAGLDYLREFETEKSNPSPININVGNNSTVQFQNNSPYSNQAIQLKSHDREDLLRLVKEIKNGMDILRGHLSPEAVENLQAETSYLESNLKKQSPDKSLLKIVTNNILDIVKAVPANVIANIITNIVQ